MYIVLIVIKILFLKANKHQKACFLEILQEIAEKAGQLAVRDICEKWLQANTGSRQ